VKAEGHDIAGQRQIIVDDGLWHVDTTVSPDELSARRDAAKAVSSPPMVIK
jgi:hypothetical protein